MESTQPAVEDGEEEENETSPEHSARGRWGDCGEDEHVTGVELEIVELPSVIFVESIVCGSCVMKG